MAAALVFAGAHEKGLLQQLMAFILGVSTCYLVEITGRLRYGLVLYLLQNWEAIVILVVVGGFATLAPMIPVLLAIGAVMFLAFWFLRGRITSLLALEPPRPRKRRRNKAGPAPLK